MFELSGWFRLVAKNRNTKARYAAGLEVGDIVKFSMDLKPTNLGRRRNTVLVVSVSKYTGGDFSEILSYETIGEATQNEFFQGFELVGTERPQWQKAPVFHVQQISYDEVVKLTSAGLNKTDDNVVELDELEVVSENDDSDGVSKNIEGIAALEEELWDLLDETEANEQTKPLINSVAEILNRNHVE